MTTPAEEWETPGNIVDLQRQANVLLSCLDEFESLITTLRDDATESQKSLTNIVSRKEELYLLCQRIDGMERFVEMVEENVNKVEQHVAVAEEELNIRPSLLKSFFGRAGWARAGETNLSSANEYVPVKIMKTDGFFNVQDQEPGSSKDEGETEMGIELGELSEDFLD